MAAVVAVIRRLLQAQLRHIPEGLLVHVHGLKAAALHVVHAGELRQRQRGLNVEHVVLEARLLDVIAPGAALAVAVPGARAHAVAGENARLFIDLLVVGHQRAALAAGEVLGRVEGIGDGALGMMADELAIVAGLHGVRRVLGEEQAVALAQSADLADIRRQAGIMHRHHRAGFVRDLLFDLPGIDEAGFRIDIGEHRRRADVQDGIGAGSEGQRRGDDLVARADALGHQGQMKRRGAGIDAHAVLRAHIFGKTLFKLNRSGALRPPAGAHSIAHSLHFRVGDIRHAERHPIASDFEIVHGNLSSCPNIRA